MAVKIRLKRFGKIRAPYYRVVVMDGRQKRDGSAIEEIGLYHPLREPSLIDIKSDRVQYWLGVGAQPSDQVWSLLKITGDWQKFKGLPGSEGKLRTPVDKKPYTPEGEEPAGEPVTAKKSGEKSDGANAATAAKAGEKTDAGA